MPRPDLHHSRFCAAAIALALLAGLSAAAATNAATAPIGRYRFANAGVWADFEILGANQQNNDLLHHLDDIQPASGLTVYNELSIQLDAMRSLGINTITVPFGTAGDNYDHPEFPTCNQMGPGSGLHFPSPTQFELTSFKRFLDLVASKQMHLIVRLTNSHEDDIPNSQIWYDAVFSVAQDHPAVEFFSFDGDLHVLDTDGDGKPDVCGGVSEPKISQGPQSQQGQFLRWAIQHAMSRGIPPRKLSAEAVAGVLVYMQQAPTKAAGAQDGHFWEPISVEKQIFDSLGIPDDQRTYGLSLYEMTRCGVLTGCAEEAPPVWTSEVTRHIRDVVGRNNGARIVAVEMGDLSPIAPGWQSDLAMEDLADNMEANGIDGGAYWLWVSPALTWENDPTKEKDVKKLGATFEYNPVARIIEDMAGFHLIGIPNGSFESGGTAPDHWAVGNVRRRRAAGHGLPASAPGPRAGTVTRYDLTAEAGQPQVPTRGKYAMRLTSGDDPADSFFVLSDPIAITAGQVYTTSAVLRFNWSGDPNPAAPAAQRPHVYVAFDYFDAAGAPVATRPSDVFRYLQQDSTTDFATFVLHYMPPAGAMSVRIEVGAHRNGLPQPIVLDVDAMR